VRDAAGVPPTVTEPTHNHAICTRARAGKIGKVAGAVRDGQARLWLARVAIKVDKGVGSA